MLKAFKISDAVTRYTTQRVIAQVYSEPCQVSKTEILQK